MQVSKRIQIFSERAIVGSGSTEIRCVQPFQYLCSLDFQVSLSRLYESAPQADSVILLHRGLLNRYTKMFLRYARIIGSVVIYDTDDLIFDGSVKAYLDELSLHNFSSSINEHAEAMKQSDMVVVSTDYLKKKALEIHPEVYVLRNALSQKYVDLSATVISSKESRKGRFFTVAYLSGTSTHKRDFKIIEQDLLELLSLYSDFKVLLVGALEFDPGFQRFGDRFEYRPFIEYQRFHEIFLEIDLNLIPLEENESFCQAKSEQKFIEAGACGVPSLASPTQVYQEIARSNDGLTLSERDQWREKISSLYLEKDQLRNLGFNTRQFILERYSPKARAGEWLGLMNCVMSRPDLFQCDKSVPFERLYLIISLTISRLVFKSSNYVKSQFRRVIRKIYTSVYSYKSKIIGASR